MATTFRVTGVQGPTGETQRARLYTPAGATAGDVALTESPSGSGQYTGETTIADLSDSTTAPYEYEVRAVATQDATGFTNSTTVRRSRGDYGWLISELWYDAPPFLNRALPSSPTADSINERIKTMDESNTPALIADAVWDEAIAGHNGAGSTGQRLAATPTGDPWSTALPGAYEVGSAGHKIGTYLDAAVSSRSTLTQAQVTGGAYALATNGSGQVTVGSIAAGGITSSSFANNSITAASLAADAVTEIADAVEVEVDAPTAAENAAAVAAALLGQEITITAPVIEDGDVEIVQGDDYLNADGRAISFVISSYTGPSMSAATPTLKLYRNKGVDRAQVSADHTFTGTTVVDGTTVTHRFDLTDVQTATLNRREWYLHLVATLSGGSVVTVLLDRPFEVT